MNQVMRPVSVARKKWKRINWSTKRSDGTDGGQMKTERLTHIFSLVKIVCNEILVYGRRTHGGR